MPYIRAPVHFGSLEPEHFWFTLLNNGQKRKGVEGMSPAPEGETGKTCWFVIINMCPLESSSNTNLFFKSLFCFLKWTFFQLWNSQRDFPLGYLGAINLCLLFLAGTLTRWPCVLIGLSPHSSAPIILRDNKIQGISVYSTFTTSGDCPGKYEVSLTNI